MNQFRKAENDIPYGIVIGRQKSIEYARLDGIKESSKI